MNLTRFIELFAPRHGARAVCLAPAGQSPRRAAMCGSGADIAEMIRRARETDQNAWVSLACFTGTRRSAKEAVDLRMIGVDIDLKPGDVPTFASKDEALAYTRRTTELGLPLPTFTIDSGHGIHLWYCFDRAVPRDRWVELSSALWAALGSLHTGFVVDTSRKRDAAGLLRLPCTTNTKEDADPVPVDFVGGEWADLSAGVEISLDALTAALRRFGSISAEFKFTPRGQLRLDPLAWRSKTETDLSVPSMVPVVAACKVLRHAYAHQATTEYGGWWPVVSACVWAGDGRDVAHAMSRAHPNYNPADVDKKFDDFADGSALPPSCSYLATAVMGDNSACLDCACHLAGRKWPHQHPEVVRALTAEPVAPAESAPQQPAEAAVPSPAPTASPPPAAEQGIPPHVTETDQRFYATSDLRMVMRSKNEDGEPTVVQLADHAIWGKRFVWNPIDQRVELVFGIARYGRDRRLVQDEVQVAARYVSGDWSAMAAPFADAGVALAAVQPKTKNALREYLIAEQSRVRDEARVTEVAHHGWQGDRSFAAVNMIFSPTGDPRPARLTASAKAHELRFARHGSVEHQLAMLRLYEQHGSDLARFIIGVSAGSPAHGLRDRGGTIAALVGRTAVGKTGLIEFGASMWGRPDMLLIRPEATIKSVYEMIGTARNLPSWVDEITYAEREDLIRMIHQIGGGGGRGALNRNGQARAVEAVPAWASAVIWTSNASIVRQMAGVSDANRAVALRVFETRVLEPTLALPDRNQLAGLPKEYARHCGHIGALLAQRYATQRDTIEAAHDGCLARMAALVPGGAAGPHRYHAQMLQTFESGAAALHDMGLWQMNQTERMRIAKVMADRAMLEATGAQVAAATLVRQYANENIERLVTVVTGGENGPQSYVPQQAAVGRLEKQEGSGTLRLRLNRVKFADWLHRHEGALDAVLAQAQAEGLLRADAEEAVDPYAGVTRLDRGSRATQGGVSVDTVTFWLPESVKA